jgi:hypothetical protein
VQQALGSRCLVAGNADHEAKLPQLLQAGARVRVQVLLAEVLGEVRLLAAKPLGCEVKPRPKVLEGLPVVLATGDDRAKHGTEAHPDPGLRLRLPPHR